MKPRLFNYPSHAKVPLIDRPSHQNGRHRLFLLALTGLAWAAWIYLWTPLFAATGWALGISSFRDARPWLSGSASLFFLFGISAACFLFTLGWVTYKKGLWTPRNWKRQAGVVSSSEIMNQQGLDPQSADHLSVASQALIRFDEEGTPVRVLEKNPLPED